VKSFVFMGNQQTGYCEIICFHG